LGAGTADSAQILRWLESARTLRPDFPAIHMALCRQYAWDPKDPAQALREGRAAVDLEPQNLANRANLGSTCMVLDLEAEAITIGDQLRQMAGTAHEKRMAESYASALKQFLERESTRSEVPAVSLPSSGELLQRQKPPLKFSLPSYLAPLGKEVLQLDAEDRTDEAIRKVEKALAKAKYPYDRKVLQALLESLRARPSAK
jgi:hypothetical protein